MVDDKIIYEIRCRKCGNIVALCNCEDPELYKTKKNNNIVYKNFNGNPDLEPIKGFSEHKEKRIRELNHRKRMHPELCQPRGC